MRYISLGSLIRKLSRTWAEKTLHRATTDQQKADYESMMERLRRIRDADPGHDADLLVCTSCYNYKSLHHRWREVTGRSVQGKPVVPRSVSAKLPFDGFRWRRRNLKKPVVTPTGGNVIQFNCLFPGCTCVKSVEFAPDNEEQYTITYPEGPHNHDPPLLKPTEGEEEGAGQESGSQEAGSGSKVTSPVGNNVSSRSGQHSPMNVSNEDRNVSFGSDALRTNLNTTSIRSQYYLPPDGYKWRKRGTILIRGHTHPRYYYQCTTPGCPAKKAFNRSLEAEDTLIITYYGGEHNHPPVMAMPPSVYATAIDCGMESEASPGLWAPVAPAAAQDRASPASAGVRVRMSTVCCCCNVRNSTSRHTTLACVIQNVAQSWAEKAGTTQEEIADYNVLMETLEAIQEQGPRPHDDGALSACMSCFHTVRKTLKWPFLFTLGPEEDVAVPAPRGTRKRSRSPHPASRPSKVPSLDGGAWGALPGAGTEVEAGDGMHGQLGEEALQMHGDLGMAGLVVEGHEEGLQYMDPMGLGYMEGNGDGNGSVQYMDQEGTHMEGDMHNGAHEHRGSGATPSSAGVPVSGTAMDGGQLSGVGGGVEPAAEVAEGEQCVFAVYHPDGSVEYVPEGQVQVRADGATGYLGRDGAWVEVAVGDTGVSDVGRGSGRDGAGVAGPAGSELAGAVGGAGGLWRDGPLLMAWGQGGSGSGGAAQGQGDGVAEGLDKMWDDLEVGACGLGAGGDVVTTEYGEGEDAAVRGEPCGSNNTVSYAGGELGSEDDEDWEEDDEDGSKEGEVRSAGHLPRICSCCNQGEHTKRRVSIVALINKLPKSFAARNPAPTPEQQEDFDDLIQRLQAVYDAGPHDVVDGALAVCTTCYNYHSKYFRWRDPSGYKQRGRHRVRRSVLSDICGVCGETQCTKQASIPTLKRNMDTTWRAKRCPTAQEMDEYADLLNRLQQILDLGSPDGREPALCKSCYDYTRIHLRWRDPSWKGRRPQRAY